MMNGSVRLEMEIMPALGMRTCITHGGGALTPLCTRCERILLLVSSNLKTLLISFFTVIQHLFRIPTGHGVAVVLMPLVTQDSLATRRLMGYITRLIN